MNDEQPAISCRIEGGSCVTLTAWVDELGYINFTTHSGYKNAKPNYFWVNPMKGDVIPGRRVSMMKEEQ
jgi:hypothetical protein